MNILTRGDLDGMTASVFLTISEKIREIRFAHPKDVQDGKIPVTAEDIVVNLPYVPGCGLWFDHHVSEEEKLDVIGPFKGRFEVAPSAARVVYNHYKHAGFEKYKELLVATDNLDSAQLTVQDVADPQGWILLGYTLDPRTGLGPEFQKYFRWLVEYAKEVSIEKILQHPEVQKRITRVRQEQEEFTKFLRAHSKLEGKVIVTDVRGGDVPVGNRFLVYSLFPQAHSEVRIIKGKGGVVVFAVGASIFNRTCNVNIGTMLHGYGGGGHKGAGTCQIPPEQSDAALKEVLARLNANKE